MISSARSHACSTATLHRLSIATASAMSRICAILISLSASADIVTAISTALSHPSRCFFIEFPVRNRFVSLTRIPFSSLEISHTLYTNLGFTHLSTSFSHFVISLSSCSSISSPLCPIYLNASFLSSCPRTISACMYH